MCLKILGALLEYRCWATAWPQIQTATEGPPFCCSFHEIFFYCPHSAELLICFSSAHGGHRDPGPCLRSSIFYFESPGNTEPLPVFIYKFSLKGNQFSQLSLVPTLAPLGQWLKSKLCCMNLVSVIKDLRGMAALETPGKKTGNFTKYTYYGSECQRTVHR